MLVYKKIITIAVILAVSIFNLSCNNERASTIPHKVIGWNILSSNKENAIQVINASVKYHVNHLQLSHNIIRDLREIKNPPKQELVNELIDDAHRKGIPEVVVWDHALYNLDYYPKEFRSAEGGKIDLDNPNFWKWLKQDYRNMLELVPKVNGIVLTFIETGSRIEDQFSSRFKTSEEKLAALVDSIASVIIDERKLKLYIRDFSYNRKELSALLKCFELIQNPKIIVMCKEVPHDFFITHPIAWWVQDIKFPVIIEFDCTHEFNGQSVVASLFPEIHFKRWEYYQSIPNVIGFSIRTDRFGSTTIINRPSEINLFAIHSLTENPNINMETIYNNFITERYGEKVLEPLKSIFKKAPEIITSTYYTLGLNTANHSSLDFDYRSIYTRHVSGRWMDNPSISINHGVNKEFQYWVDIVNHLSPSKYKTDDEKNSKEIPEVVENNWIQPKELMNEEYLSYVITEKEYGRRLATDALAMIGNLKDKFKDRSSYTDLYNTFERTELTSRLFLGMAKAYYGYRIYMRGQSFRTQALVKTIGEGLKDISNVADKIKKYEKPYPLGQYDWKKDADIAMDFYDKINGSSLTRISN